ncbi:MAG TPA: hypothetical protein VJX66_04510 [Amycolatopsis sp.]|nr:hypothetical protein [Amycolatopsis sp.]
MSPMVTGLLGEVSRASEELDALAPLGDPLLWAARCALDASALLLRAYTADDHEATLEAVAAARASVVAAANAAWRKENDG